jgi:hypothetical protein
MDWIQVTFASHKDRGFLEQLNTTFRERSRITWETKNKRKIV